MNTTAAKLTKKVVIRCRSMWPPAFAFVGEGEHAQAGGQPLDWLGALSSPNGDARHDAVIDLGENRPFLMSLIK